MDGAVVPAALRHCDAYCVLHAGRGRSAPTRPSKLAGLLFVVCHPSKHALSCGAISNQLAGCRLVRLLVPGARLPFPPPGGHLR